MRYAGGQQWPLWGHLLDSIKTGKTARELMTGEELFENLERDPAAAAISSGFWQWVGFLHYARIVTSTLQIFTHLIYNNVQILVSTGV